MNIYAYIYEVDNSDDNLPSVLIIKMMIIIEVGGDIVPSH